MFHVCYVLMLMFMVLVPLKGGSSKKEGLYNIKIKFFANSKIQKSVGEKKKMK